MCRLIVGLPKDARRFVISQLSMQHPIPVEFEILLPQEGEESDRLIEHLGEEAMFEVSRTVWSDEAQICEVTSDLTSASPLYFPMSLSVDAQSSAIQDLVERMVDEDPTLHYFEPSSTHPIRLIGMVRFESEIAPLSQSVA